MKTAPVQRQEHSPVLLEHLCEAMGQLKVVHSDRKDGNYQFSGMSFEINLELRCPRSQVEYPRAQAMKKTTAH